MQVSNLALRNVEQHVLYTWYDRDDNRTRTWRILWRETRTTGGTSPATAMSQLIWKSKSSEGRGGEGRATAYQSVRFTDNKHLLWITGRPTKVVPAAIYHWHTRIYTVCTKSLESSIITGNLRRLPGKYFPSLPLGNETEIIEIVVFGYAWARTFLSLFLCNDCINTRNSRLMKLIWYQISRFCNYWIRKCF